MNFEDSFAAHQRKVKEDMEASSRKFHERVKASAAEWKGKEAKENKEVAIIMGCFLVVVIIMFICAYIHKKRNPELYVAPTFESDKLIVPCASPIISSCASIPSFGFHSTHDVAHHHHGHHAHAHHGHHGV